MSDLTKHIEYLRNIAIIAHVDHGKTTLVDKLLQQSGTLDSRKGFDERVMDSNDLEKERGITILSKNTALKWKDYRINIVDTPGHADFGGEVERVLSMVDSVLLLVDAQEGPMPQTRFVTSKALAQGLRPIVVINKIDKPAADPDNAINLTYDLFVQLGATDEQLDFPIVYASGFHGYAGLTEDVREGDMTPLFETIVEHCHSPIVDPEGHFQIQVTSLDYDNFEGVIGIGRIARGRVKSNMQITLITPKGDTRNGRILKLYGYHGLTKVEANEAYAGDIIAFTGVDDLRVSDTLCDPMHVEALKPLSVDEPTISMDFSINTGPLVSTDKATKFVTTRNLRDRLDKELIYNVALRVEETEDPDRFKVSGRGELHLSVLIETMRREGYELCIGRPQVIQKEINGIKMEPFEELTVDVQEEHQGTVMEKLGERKGTLTNMEPDGQGRVRLNYIIPARGLIGFRTEFLTATQGSGLIYHTFHNYGPVVPGAVAKRLNGVLISNGKGKSVAFALFGLQDRGKMLIGAGEEIYEGMIIGIHSRSNDLVVNGLKAKQLTNVRASGTDEALTLVPHVKFSLEQALEFIDDDELVEVTPNFIRIRKRYLDENERKRMERSKKD
jgi:GTP-binding protein